MSLPRTGEGGRPGPLRAALLSFAWSGLGHLALRRRAAALVFAAPLVAVLLFALALVAGRGVQGAGLFLLNPAAALSLCIVLVGTGLWRLIAVGDSVRLARRAGTRTRTFSAFGILVVAVAIVAPHALGAWYAWSLYDAGRQIFTGDTASPGNASPAPGSSGGPTLAPGATPTPTPDPAATPASSNRFTVLLTGIDSGPGRTHALTDTMIVVSVDRTTGTAVMASFPRDIARFRLYDGGTYAGRLNSLQSWADANPGRYPDGGNVTLARELGYLLGIPVPYYAAVDLAGFEQMITAVGGVTVDNPKAIDDPGYGGWTDGRPAGFRLSAGVHELDGQTALAFVRSRKGTGDNDFQRARRQQLLLVALGRKLADPAMFPRLPAILGAAKNTVRTNVPPEELQQLLEAANSVRDDGIRKVVLGPPYAERIDSPTTYLLQLVQAKLEQVSIDLFGNESRYATPGAG